MIVRRSRPLLLLLLLATACFELRTPELPAPTEGRWTPPTSPDILLENFRQATATLNLTNYERCFDAATFQFMPDPTVLGNNVGIFRTWSLIDEIEYLKNVREASATNATTRNLLTLERLGADTYLTPDSLLYVARYTLRIDHQDEEQLPYFTFEGNMQLTLRFRNNEWAISQWQDNQSTTVPCWTKLKEHFIVN